jgi:hypothetical protein
MMSGVSGSRRRLLDGNLPKIKKMNPDEWLNIPIPLVECIHLFRREHIEKSIIVVTTARSLA